MRPWQYKTDSHKQIEHKKENSQTKISAQETESHRAAI